MGRARSPPIARMLDLAATLDTPERAQAFRLGVAQRRADAAALSHVGAEGAHCLTHREAMELVATRLRAQPAQPGDVAYVDARASLDTRLALAAFVGDGLTTTALGVDGRTSADVVALRPHKLLVGRSWLEAACEGSGPRWPAGLDRSRTRRAAGAAGRPTAPGGIVGRGERGHGAAARGRGCDSRWRRRERPGSAH